MRTRPRRPSAAGFTLVELLVSLAITLMVIGAALTAAQNARKANDLASQMLEMNGSLRVAADLMVRDLIQTGQGLPEGNVIEKPNGSGATEINRPGPAAAGLTFDVDATEFTAVTPGPGQGPAFTEPRPGGGTVTGPATDTISVMYLDNQFSGISCQIAANGRVVVVDPASKENGADISGTGVSDPLMAGDLIVLTGTESGGSAMAMITKVAGQSVHLAADDAMNLNQDAAEAGTVLQLLGTPAKATDALISRIRMITYFIDNSQDPPRLMRQLNYNTARVVAPGIDNLQITYDISDGGTNPTNVKSPDTPTQIRKVNLYLSARSRRRSPSTGAYLRNSLATQVSLRSLAFVDRYQ